MAFADSLQYGSPREEELNGERCPERSVVFFFEFGNDPLQQALHRLGHFEADCLFVLSAEPSQLSAGELPGRCDDAFLQFVQGESAAQIFSDQGISERLPCGWRGEKPLFCKGFL